MNLNHPELAIDILLERHVFFLTLCSTVKSSTASAGRLVEPSASSSTSAALRENSFMKLGLSLPLFVFPVLFFFFAAV